MSNPDNNFIHFNCSIPNLHTAKIMQCNGTCTEPLDMPENVLCKVETGKTIIEIPDNIHLKLPLQMVNVLSDKQDIQTQTQIRIGKGSKVQFIHCDDSLGEQEAKSVNAIDVFLDTDSAFDYYKMENLNNDSSIETNVNFHLSQGSQLTTYGFSLNGRHIGNMLNVYLNEPHSTADLNGLYLMDRQQKVETVVNVFHMAETCRSKQLFKGILDDAAQATFLGHVFVNHASKGTEAMQINKNILLTDKAKVNARPFLEIYNDDVKCSHGATTGQLDEDAMFYLRSRGISFRSARMLLMYAFCREVLTTSNIEPLKESIGEIIKMRLQGELSACTNCVFQCAAAHSINELTKP
ncbi:MAG: Fe-S cluster assembly protein SufD [Bacteroidales bacterium]|jgi:Fe-S cluster assembly protein SufD|nr:Fe-S cluster assembly protein SufD [Bacteroidales bacterium]